MCVHWDKMLTYDTLSTHSNDTCSKIIIKASELFQCAGEAIEVSEAAETISDVAAVTVSLIHILDGSFPFVENHVVTALLILREAREAFGVVRKCS